LTWIAFIQVLPELIKLVRAMLIQTDLRGADGINKNKELKKNIEKLSQAIKDNDEKTLNDLFNSL